METKQTNPDGNVNSIIEKIRKYMCVGDGYVPTTIDYLIISGLMEIVKMSVAVLIAPLVNGAAVVCSFIALKSALASNNKKLMIIACLFLLFDLYSLISQKGYIQQ